MYYSSGPPPPPLSLAIATVCTCLIGCMRATLSAHLIILYHYTSHNTCFLCLKSKYSQYIIFRHSRFRRCLWSICYLFPKFLSPLPKGQCGWPCLSAVTNAYSTHSQPPGEHRCSDAQCKHHGLVLMQAEALSVPQPAYGYHTITAKPQRNTNTHRTRAIQPMK